MVRPLADVTDQVGDGHASYARQHAQAFIDTFAGLGIQPDRYYWMSEIYAAGAWIRTSERPRPSRPDPRDLPHGDHRPPSGGLASGQVICENAAGLAPRS